jgi:hypothetical protein
MKRNKLANLKWAAATAVGVALGRGAQADTILNFDARSPNQQQNEAVRQTFGDNVAATGTGVEVIGFATPDIGLTWFAAGTDARWDYYIDAVWSAGQLNNAIIGNTYDLTFTPSPTKAVVIKSFNFHPYYNDGTDYEMSWAVLAGATVLTNGSISFPADATKNHPVSINYSGAPSQELILQIQRTGGSGRDDSMAVDDIRFAQLPEPTGPLVISISPGNGQTSVRPDAPFDARITNGVTQLAPASIQLFLNRTSVVPQVTPWRLPPTSVSIRRRCCRRVRRINTVWCLPTRAGANSRMTFSLWWRDTRTSN